MKLFRFTFLLSWLVTLQTGAFSEKVCDELPFEICSLATQLSQTTIRMLLGQATNNQTSLHDLVSNVCQALNSTSRTCPDTLTSACLSLSPQLFQVRLAARAARLCHITTTPDTLNNLLACNSTSWLYAFQTIQGSVIDEVLHQNGSVEGPAVDTVVMGAECRILRQYYGQLPHIFVKEQCGVEPGSLLSGFMTTIEEGYGCGLSLPNGSHRIVTSVGAVTLTFILCLVAKLVKLQW
ncbi:uncharacterized protein LOC129584424 [Paramacrobiotus metropolitanus]|uniref:uncharacterized protein LOC129584424 n=1 Tax=Paramacrobiotus metropolitanus TaxID=2943436 RepID=UPI002445FE6D|nr:uncharacterized protein LOC129584424 [Paramacrobiotus metropolitanus]